MASPLQDNTDKRVDVDIEPPHDVHAAASGSRIEEADFVTHNEERDLSRGLKQRHISLIALAGAIGTGLFLGLGGSIQTAGPLGALLGYMTIGLIVCCVQFALGEVTALLPVTGSFVRHAEFLVDPAMGFAIGWVSTPGSSKHFQTVYPNLPTVNLLTIAEFGLWEFPQYSHRDQCHLRAVSVLDRHQFGLVDYDLHRTHFCDRHLLHRHLR